MENANSGLKMPKQYVDMDAQEMEYDGGFSWSKIGTIVMAVGVAAIVGGMLVGGIGAAIAYGPGEQAAMGLGLKIMGAGGVATLAGGGMMAADGPGGNK